MERLAEELEHVCAKVLTTAERLVNLVMVLLCC